MSHKGSEIYDVSRDEAEIIKWRSQRRLLLRNEFLKEIHSPNSKQGDLMDEQIFRLYSTNMLKEELYKPKPNHFLKIAGGIFIFYLTFKLVQNDRNHKDYLIRTGQLSYRDRDFKFC